MTYPHVERYYPCRYCGGPGTGFVSGQHRYYRICDRQICFVRAEAENEPVTNIVRYASKPYLKRLEVVFPYKVQP